MDVSKYEPRTIDSPAVSVVMSVYNGESKLPDTLDSVLMQKGVDVELIVIDDGSTDHSLKILERYSSRDSRVRVLTQPNTGLTRSLIRGVEAASNDFVTRQDVGDIYYEGKLKKQAEFLLRHPEVALVSCGTRFVGPRREPLFEISQTSEDLSTGLVATEPGKLRGPSSHPSVMFRKALYLRVGGYRTQFKIAQDVDLWVRLREIAPVSALDEILVEAEITPNSLSGVYRAKHRTMGELIVQSAAARRSGGNESSILGAVESVASGKARYRRQDVSNANYFIGRLLQTRRDLRCLRYFREALLVNPMNIRAMLMLIVSPLSCVFSKGRADRA